MFYLYGNGVLAVREHDWEVGWRLARAFAPPGVDFKAMSLVPTPHPIGARALSPADSMEFARALHSAIDALKTNAALSDDQRAAWASSASNVGDLRTLADFSLSGGFAIT